MRIQPGDFLGKANAVDDECLSGSFSLIGVLVEVLSEKSTAEQLGRFLAGGS